MIRSRLRPAFSLIELLVVIALMSVLAALAAGTYFRVRAAQMVNATEASLNKLNSGLDRLFAATRDQADKEFSSGQLIANVPLANLLNFAGANEKDRARAIWIYFRLKNEFPQTFPEAVSPTTLSGVFSLPAKQTFLVPLTGSSSAATTAKINSLAPVSASDANLQAAALLYLIVSQKGSRGEVFDADILKAHVVQQAMTGGTFNVFMDAWGTPITYIRFLTNNEVNELPYSRNSGLANSYFNNTSSFPVGVSNPTTNSPVDVTNRLINAPWGTEPGWTATSPTSHFNIFCSSAGILASNTEAMLRLNFLPCVISAGADKDWNSLDVRGIAPFAPASPYSNVGIVQLQTISGAGIEGVDNLYGYRLRKYGARSD